MFRVRCSAFLLVTILLSTNVTSYEKTLRKIVRNQSKMVRRPFSEDNEALLLGNSSSSLPVHFDEELVLTGVSQRKPTFYNLLRPRISTTMLPIQLARIPPGDAKMKLMKADPLADRNTRNTLATAGLTQKNERFIQNSRSMYSNTNNVTVKNYYQIPTTSIFFPPIDERDGSFEQKYNDNNNNTINTLIIPDNHNDNRTMQITGIFIPQSQIKSQRLGVQEHKKVNENQSKTDNIDTDKNGDHLVEGLSIDSNELNLNSNTDSFACVVIKPTKADIDAQEQFCQLNIEPSWMINKQYWNKIFDGRYDSLMRNPKWPPLKVILLPRVHVDTIWKKTFEQYHKESVSKILSNVVKKLQFYENLTFSWNEVSHLSKWWKGTTYKNRMALRKLLKGGRLEITTGGWVETDEATTHLFGLIHQLIEGHQWLKSHLNYYPKVAWVTNSVSHSPTMTYLLSALNINQLVFTNLHYSWEEYLAEFQYSDFVWIQNWEEDNTFPSKLNEDLSKIGNDRHPRHAVLAHYLQFNSAEFSACGPDGSLCKTEYNFANSNKNFDITSFNIKDRAEKLLEQYSKTGTTSLHNTIIAPIGGPYHYESQTEFDYQYNNYLKIADYINVNKDIYKATVEFGTAQDYFSSIISRHKNYPTLKGDFLIFADISSGTPAYWTGFYTSRPYIKILLRRLQSTLRTTEILFSFALNYNVFRRFNLSDIYELLIKSRESVARLLDRNVISGTLTANSLRYVYDQILITVKDCWYIQELSASFLTLKPEINIPYLQKYVYRDGQFISRFRSLSPGDQIYLFNSLSHETTEIVEIITRFSNIRILDHNKKDVTIQINPVWKHNLNDYIRLSRKFFKICFAVTMPPLALALFEIKETYDASQNAATLYCLSCKIDDARNEKVVFPFRIHPIQPGDIQLESYKYRLIFDEFTGFMKTVVEKETNIAKTVFVDYGAFRDSSNNSGMFLFNTNVNKPLHDILTNYKMVNKSKIMMIVSGQVTTELITIYGRLLQHTTKIFNLLTSPLSSAIYIESKVDYEISPKNRELEMFLSIQTDITNGNPPLIFTDNNSYQYTPRILNLSRRVESNMNPITSMAFIQDKRSRLTFVTDHALGVTALQEGQLVIMLDRRVLFDDGRGTNEGLADSSATCHRHYILLENLDYSNKFRRSSSQAEVILPSINALYLANTLNYILDVFIIDKNHSDLCYYRHLSLIRTAFPCDVSIVNYRIMLNRNNLQFYTPISALMILHRQNFSCKIISSISLQCPGDSNFALDMILRNVKAIYQTNLAGTDAGNPQHSFNLVNFPPMGIITLRIDF